MPVEKDFVRMGKILTTFACSKCDAQFSKWLGRCLECGAWGTLVESIVTKETKTAPSAPLAEALIPSTLGQIAGEKTKRLPTGIQELDRVLGGGLVPGSFILLGGEPGIGKSTLALMIGASIPSTLILSAEESIEQVKLRADRLGVRSPNLKLASTSSLETILATIRKEKPTFAIVDSIQTIASERILGEPGSVSQIRGSAAELLTLAKTDGIAILIIGHVTKDGALAGPKTLEHLVDTVLYFEGDGNEDFRLLRGVKNRFGSTDEVGVFEMHETGLRELGNPSARLIRDRSSAAPGSVVTCLLQGTRPMLVEIQALVNKTVFGYPVRKASGFDLNRLHVLTAVLQKRAGLNLSQYDIHINVAGGIRADEPAADLAVCLAIASAYKDKVLGNDLVVFGEVGLGGEVRNVRQTDKRLHECETLGMKRVILPKQTHPSETTIKLIAVGNIQELITQNT